jgi:hypothetical protein
VAIFSSDDDFGRQVLSGILEAAKRDRIADVSRGSNHEQVA